MVLQCSCTASPAVKEDIREDIRGKVKLEFRSNFLVDHKTWVRFPFTPRSTSGEAQAS